MSSLLQTHRIALRSPALFIGGPEQTFGPGSIALDESNERAHLLDQEVLAELAVQSGTIDRLAELIGRSSSRQLAMSLPALAGAAWKTATWDGRPLVYASIGFAPGQIGQFDPYQAKPFIRDGYGKAYVPGSSIKGALRNAVLFALMGPEGIERLAVGRDADARLRLGFNRSRDPKVNSGTRSQPNDDLFRAFKISDSTSIPDDCFCLTRSYVAAPGSRDLGVPILAEYAFDVSVQFDVTLDNDLLRRYQWGSGAPIRSITELFDRTVTFANRLREADEAFYRGTSDQQTAPKSAFETVDAYQGALQRYAVERMGRRPSGVQELQAFVQRFQSDFQREYGPPPSPAGAPMRAPSQAPSLPAMPPPTKDGYYLRIGMGSGLLGTTLSLDRTNEQRATAMRRTSAGSFVPSSRKLVVRGVGFMPLGWCEMRIIA